MVMMMMKMVVMIMMVMIVILLYFLVPDSQHNDIYLCTKGALILSPCNDLSTFYLDHLSSDWCGL